MLHGQRKAVATYSAARLMRPEGDAQLGFECRMKSTTLQTKSSDSLEDVFVKGCFFEWLEEGRKGEERKWRGVLEWPNRE